MPAKPIASDVDVTVMANSTDNSIALKLSGGEAESVAVDQQPKNGTATASGKTISYTPMAGYSGADSFTYVAKSATGTSDPATVNITITAPALAISPQAGALPGGTVGAGYRQSLSASLGTAPYTFALTFGDLPVGVSLDDTGLISGIPTVAGDTSFVVSATDDNGATGTVSYTLSIAISAPVAGDSSATVAANSADNAITLDLSGGEAESVAVDQQASHGTAAASGTTITYTPAVGYSGTDSFTYSATNTTGTSQSATVSITVSAPILGIAPQAGALPGGTVGSAYSQTLSASLGTAPYRFAVTSGTLPDGLSLDSATGLISGTPTKNGNAGVTVTATDVNGATGTVDYTLAIGAKAPVAGNVSATVAANSAGNAITLDLSGGDADYIAIAAQAGHGTATAVGTTVTYTPDTGYSGFDSFTYVAKNATGTSDPATVSITVSAPALSPSAGALSGGTVGKAYRQSVSASGGTAPYSFAITAGALPDGLSLDSATGLISGTAAKSGFTGFIVTATDANGAIAVVNYTIAIAEADVDIVFSPKAGALSDGTVGKTYSQSISASGGTAPYRFSYVFGSMPKGLSLNGSTGLISGTPTEAGKGAFQMMVTDAKDVKAVATYTIAIAAAAVDFTFSPKAGALSEATAGQKYSQTISANGGAGVLVYSLTSGSLPKGLVLNASTGELAGTLDAKTGGDYSFVIGVRDAKGATGKVAYSLIVKAETVTMPDTIDPLVLEFVRSRQGLIASTIKVPGLLERRQMGKAGEAVTTRLDPSEKGLTLGFATSLSQMDAARNGADAYLPAFNAWIDGSVLAHNDKDINGDKWGSFAMLNMGADYLVTDKALIGLSVHYDRMTDPTDADEELKGNGWLAGPYASLELGRNIFWNSSLLYGGSSNTIDTPFWDGSFDTTRFLVDTSLSGQWLLDEATTLTPKIRAVYFSESVEDYSVHNDNGDVVDIEGFDEEQFRGSLGAEVARSFLLENGSTLTPKLGLTVGYSGIDGSGLYGSLSAGASLQTADLWTLDASLLVNAENDASVSVGGKLGAAKKF